MRLEILGPRVFGPSFLGYLFPRYAEALVEGFRGQMSRLKNPAERRENDQGIEPPVKNQTSLLILYTRVGCHLCDDAYELLQRYGLAPQLIDVDSDPQLVERYGCCVPVVVLDGKVRFRGRVNEVLLRRLLRRKPAG